MLSIYFLKKLTRAKAFAAGLETITEKGIADMGDLQIRSKILGYDYENEQAEVLNKVESVEKITAKGDYYSINEKLTLHENQSVVANGNVTHAKLLKIGDELIGLGGKKIVVSDITRVRGRYNFYRVKISGNHTYFLNGILMHNASRFWVGGTGTWDSTTTTNWAASTGGAGGASAPSTSDAVIFDALSGTGTCTLSGTPNCAGYDASASSVLTFTGTGTLTCAGNFALKSGLTISGWTGTITYTGTGAQTITSAGKTMALSIIINSNGGSYTLQDNWATNVNTKSITLTLGTLDTNGKNVTASSLQSSNSNVRTLTLGASAITLGTGGNTINFSTSTNLTLNANTSTITLSSTSGWGIEGGGKTFNNVTISAWNPGANGFINGSPTFAALTLTGSANVPTGFGKAGLTFGGDIVVTGLLTINGQSATNRLSVFSSTIHTTRTITAGSTTLSNVGFQDITGAGAAAWTGTSIGNGGGNSGITFTTPVNRYYVGNTASWYSTASWSATSGGASGASIPLPQDSTFFDSHSFSGVGQTLTLDYYWIPNMDWSAVTNSPTMALSGVGREFVGSVKLAAGMSVTTAGAAFVMLGVGGTTTFDGAGVSLPQITIDAYGTVQIVGTDLLVNASLVFFNGTFDANNFNITAKAFAATTSTTRTLLMGSGTWTMTGVGGTGIWTITATGLTLTPSTSTIKITDSTAQAVTFAGGGKTYYNLWFSRGASAATNTISGSNTFNDFKDDGTAAHSDLFTTGTTQHFTSFHVKGSAGNLITISSTTTGTHALVKDGGGLVICDYLVVAHSVATPGTTWYAGANSTNSQATSTAGSGWIFTAAPTDVTKASRYAVKAPVQKTKGLIYAVRAPPAAPTKSLKYTIRITPAAKTKALRYAIKAGIAITKSLKYTLKITASAITKSLIYAVKITPAAITKGLIYEIKKSISITKSLQYTIKAPASITKSLKYTIKITPGAIIKSLRYAIGTQLSITKGLRYAIRPTISITKSLQYAIKASPGAITKALKYTLLTTLAATKSLRYAIRLAPSVITKGLIYRIATIGAVTKPIQYAIKAGVSITKSLKYTIKSPAAITKTLAYRITITPAAISKALQYEIKTITAITKGLRYALKTSQAITKSVEYKISGIPHSITKALQYEIKSVISITKSLKYTITITPPALTKSLQYEIRTATAITKIIRYAVTKAAAISKALQYAVKAPAAAIQKTLKYEIRISISITKGLRYEIVRPLSITKTLRYAVKAPTAITKTLAYDIKTSPAITKQLKYVIRTSHLITKSLEYRVRINPYKKKTSPYSKKTNVYTKKPTSPYSRHASPYSKKTNPYSKF